MAALTLPPTVTSVNPLGPADKAVFEPRLVGEWPGGCLLEKDGDGYRLTHKGDPVARVTLFETGIWFYADVADGNGHTFYQVWVLGNQVVLRPLDVKGTSGRSVVLRRKDDVTAAGLFGGRCRTLSCWMELREARWNFRYVARGSPKKAGPIADALYALPTVGVDSEVVQAVLNFAEPLRFASENERRNDHTEQADMHGAVAHTRAELSAAATYRALRKRYGEDVPTYRTDLMSGGRSRP